MVEQCLHSRTEPAYLGRECVGRKCRLCDVLLLALNKDVSERIDGLEAELAAAQRQVEWLTILLWHVRPDEDGEGGETWATFAADTDMQRLVAEQELAALGTENEALVEKLRESAYTYHRASHEYMVSLPDCRRMPCVGYRALLAPKEARREC